jgi:glycosyltransferase involved in cell wall biosynthesis
VKVAVVQDWLVTLGGAEKCLNRILAAYPNADLFALVDFLSDEQREQVFGKRARTSFLQRLPGAQRRYRSFLPLMPLAIEQFDLSDYDLVISSSYAVAKGVLTGPNQLHISYIHSPPRYAWDLQFQYLKEAKLEKGIRSAVARMLLHYIRTWDVRTASGPDKIIVNSKYISRRIRKTYGRDSTVIYPPVDIERFKPSNRFDGFYFTASRLVPYKKIPLIAEAFKSLPHAKLVVIGDGPEMAKLRAAAGSNVEILGYQPDAVFLDYMQRCEAFIYAAEEDFGIVPVEAQASGKPVLALGRGGALETVNGIDHAEPTGLFFWEQTADAIVGAVRQFESLRTTRPSLFAPETCRDNAMRFSTDRFDRELREFIGMEIDRFDGWAPDARPASASSAFPELRPGGQMPAQQPSPADFGKSGGETAWTASKVPGYEQRSNVGSPV